MEESRLRYKDMPGVPHEERMARLAASREAHRRAMKAARAQAAVDKWLAEHPADPIPERISVLFCAHAVMRGCGWPPGLIWAGGITRCPCCEGLYPTMHEGFTEISCGNNEWTLVENPQWRCHYCEENDAEA